MTPILLKKRTFEISIYDSYLTELIAFVNLKI